MTMQYAGEVRVLQLEVGDYGNNCYILIDPRTQESVIIDAAADPGRILDATRGTTVRYIVTTHGHRDHWGALEEVAKGLPEAMVAASPADAEALPVTVSLPLNDGDTLQVGTVPLRVIGTPGHTPGSICLITGKHLFTVITV